jgi:large subunit ribosomal protein L11
MAAPKKEIFKKVKLEIEAGKANPAPPVGPALGQAGANIMEFCKQFNDRTKAMQGKIPVKLVVYKDKSFEFITKLPAMSYFIKKELGLEKGSKAPGLTQVAKMSRAQLENVAKAKLPDLNTTNLEAAMKIVAGQAITMGIDVEGQD